MSECYEGGNDHEVPNSHPPIDYKARWESSRAFSEELQRELDEVRAKLQKAGAALERYVKSDTCDYIEGYDGLSDEACDYDDCLRCIARRALAQAKEVRS